MQTNNLGIVSQPLFGHDAKLRGVVLNPRFAQVANEIEATTIRVEAFSAFLSGKLGAEAHLSRRLYTFHGEGMLLMSLRGDTDARQCLQLNRQTWRGESTRDNLIYVMNEEACHAEPGSREWLLAVFSYWVEFMFIAQLQVDEEMRQKASHLQ
jgi:hypothetical protein